MVANKIRGPQQTTVLDRDVIVLRELNWKKVSPGLYDILAKTNLVPGVREEQVAWFDEGFIANDHPRDALVTHELMKVTKGFAVARTDTGEILATFGKDELGKADRAAAGAKIKLDIDFELEDTPAEEDEDEDLED